MMINWNGTGTTYFKIKDDFLNNYKWKKPNWGPIGEIVYKRTYARILPNGETERWWQTVKRVVEGVYTIQKRHCMLNNLPWSEKKAHNSSQKMYDLIFNFKFLPPGRGLWIMGTEYAYTKGNASLMNCGFASTEHITTNFAEPFCFLMDMSMLGVGVGGDTKGAGKLTIREPKLNDETFYVQDTREGWVDLIRMLLNAFSGEGELPKTIDYSLVRAKGELIKGFGGISSGPQPLIDLYNNINKLLSNKIGNKISSIDIVDIFNMIGKCVVSGNIRRSAEIMLGEITDQSFLDLKNPDKQTNFWGESELEHHRWASNNTVLCKVGDDYSNVSIHTGKNGEPGYYWIENARKFGRMKDKANNKDYRVMGINPCGEQPLEHMELCNLVETFPTNHDNLNEWLETLKYAYMYAKTVTLIPCHNPKANAVMFRNRRIGCSITGITQAFKKFGKRNFFNKCDEGYKKIKEWDEYYSDWLCVPKSIKMTTVKPSGSISKLSGVTSGIHYPVSEYYIQNIRFQDTSPLLETCKNAGLKIEKDVYSDNTFVVSFPIKEKFFEKSSKEVSMWEQLENASQMQKYWADNAVSITVTFNETEAKEIGSALELYEDKLKSVSFLPYQEHGYKQAPWIPITKEEYEKLMSKVTALKFSGETHEVTEKFCDGDQCTI